MQSNKKMPYNYVKMVNGCSWGGRAMGMKRGLIVYNRAHKPARTRVPCPWVHVQPPTAVLAICAHMGEALPPASCKPSLDGVDAPLPLWPWVLLGRSRQDSATCTQPRAGALSLMSNSHQRKVFTWGILSFPFSSPHPWKCHHSGGQECVGRLR